MDLWIALPLIASMAGTAPAPEHCKKAPALLAQATTLASTPGAVVSIDEAMRAKWTQSRGDSLKNGALIGALIGGAAMGSFIYFLCTVFDDSDGESECLAGTLLWTGIGAAGGAAIGAGIDALLDRRMPVPARTTGWKSVAPVRVVMRVRF